MDIKNKNYYPIVFGTRILNSISGLFAAVVIISKYSAYEAGEIYALLSISGLLFVLEAGLPVIVLQRASTIASNASWKNSTSRLKLNLALPLAKHYVGIAICIGLFFGCIGYFVGIYFLPEYIFKNKSIWLWFCISLGLTLPLSTVLNFIEGLGNLMVVAKIRLVQSLISQTIFFLALMMQFGSVSVPMQISAAAFVGISILVLYSAQLLKVFNLKGKLRTWSAWISVEQLHNDWSLQWRLWVNSVAAYFSNQAWVLGVSLTGQVFLAAKIGIALQVVTAAVGFTITPIGSRLSQLAILASAGAKEKYKSLSKKLIIHSFITFAMIMFAAVVGYGIVLPMLPNAHGKLLDTEPAILLGLAIPLVACSSALMAFNQSLGRDDMYWISILKILIPFVSIVMMGERLIEMNVAIIYVLVSASVFIASWKVHSLSTKRCLCES